MMMALPKTAPPGVGGVAGLPGSLGHVHLPAFKRKRIEQWCQDVATYLRAGSLCRSVIGHSPEDSHSLSLGGGGGRLPGPAVKSAPAGGSQRSGPMTISAIPNPAHAHASGGVIVNSNANTTDSQPYNNQKNAGSAGGITTGNSNNNNNNNATARLGGTTAATTSATNTKMADAAPPPGRGTPMPDASGPLPVVRFSYSNYSEQRRRVDRLVQGLPVLSAANGNGNGNGNGGGNNNNASNGDRLLVNERLVNGVVVFVEEPVRSGGSRNGGRTGRASPAPNPAHPPRSNSRSSSGEPRHRGRPAQPSRHHSVSPTPPRHNNHHNNHGNNNKNHHHHHHHNNNINNSHNSNNNNNNASQPGTPKGSAPGRGQQSQEITVQEDREDLAGDRGQGFHGTGVRSMRLEGLKRSRSLKVQRARQHMLASTRRSGDQGNHSHVPVQSCWTLAELTW